MELKIIITGIDKDRCLEIGQKVIEIDDNLSIAPKFTSDKNYYGLNETLDFYMDLSNIYLAYKNNALLYVETGKDNISSGITIDDFINNDICIIPIKDFNMIADKTLYENNILVVWVDDKYKGIEDFSEIKYLQERLQNMKYLYFFGEENFEISNTIISYINASEEEKIEILENNS